MSPARIVILGAGGHGRVVLDAMRAMQREGSQVEIVGFVDPHIENPVDGLAVLGGDAALGSLGGSGAATHFIVGLGCTRGGSGVRQRVFEAGRAAGLSPFAVVHPSAIVSPRADIGPGAAVMAGAILNAGVHIGENGIINTGAIVDHDGRIGAHAHVAPGAVLSGEVSVGPDALIGAGAACRQGVKIGAGATIGAGAAVVSDIQAGAVATGVPARQT